MYIEKKKWDVLDKANLVGKNSCQSINEYDSRGVFQGLFLAAKMKYWLTKNEFGIIEEQKTFEGFIDSKRLLDRSQYFKMIEGKKMSARLPKSWKKLVISGVIIPAKI